MAYFNYNRRKSSVAQIGDTPMGGENPIRIQSMANVSTMDTEAAVAQAIRMIEAGIRQIFGRKGEDIVNMNLKALKAGYDLAQSLR